MTQHETRRPYGNIILTGFMGTGKSSVGRLLAARLGFTFVDTDAAIESRCGQTVHEIFRDRGEPAFRAMEAALAQELGAGDRQVIATGGRMMLDSANAAALSRHGLIFCLWATPEEILERLSGASTAVRPLLEGPDPEARIRLLYEERQAGYKQFSPVTTSGKTITAVVEELLAMLNIPPV
mgnify:CR=1 FL=1